MNIFHILLWLKVRIWEHNILQHKLIYSDSRIQICGYARSYLFRFSETCVVSYLQTLQMINAFIKKHIDTAYPYSKIQSRMWRQHTHTHAQIRWWLTLGSTPRGWNQWQIFTWGNSWQLSLRKEDTQNRSIISSWFLNDLLMTHVNIQL